MGFINEIMTCLSGFRFIFIWLSKTSKLEPINLSLTISDFSDKLAYWNKVLDFVLIGLRNK